MWALVFDTFGGPDVLSYRELPDPVPGPGHVLVAMKAVGLNFADIYRRRGNYALESRAHHIAGYEGAGIVAAVGAGVKEFDIGDRIGFADVPYANATMVSVPVSKAILLPPEMKFTDAAAVLLQGLTAQYLMEDSYRVRSGEWVLVQAAGGGVGQHLTRLCVSRGAKVIAMASSQEKRNLAKDAGAIHTLDYQDDWASVVRNLTDGGVHVAYDSVGTTLAQSIEAIRARGTAVTFGMSGGDIAQIDPRCLMQASKSLVGGDLWNFLTDERARRSRAVRLFEALQKKLIRAPRIETFLLSDGANAHRRLEDRAFSGKIIMVPD